MDPESYACWSPATARKPASFTIRPGTESDIEACVHLVVGLGAGDDSAWRQTLTRTVRDGQHRMLFVAEAENQIAGYGRVVRVDTDPQLTGAPPAGWYLLGLAVAPVWRRRGIGEALTKARMVWVAERADQLYCFVGQGNLPSRALHERLGFTAIPGAWIPPGGQPGDAGSQQFYRADLSADARLEG